MKRGIFFSIVAKGRLVRERSTNRAKFFSATVIQEFSEMLIVNYLPVV